MQQEILNRFKAASGQGRSNDIIKLATALQAEGLSQLEIYNLFEHYMLYLRAQEREQEEEKVADVMNRIVGWCSPHMHLFPNYLKNDEIQRYKQKRGH